MEKSQPFVMKSRVWLYLIGIHRLGYSSGEGVWRYVWKHTQSLLTLHFLRINSHIIYLFNHKLYYIGIDGRLECDVGQNLRAY